MAAALELRAKGASSRVNGSASLATVLAVVLSMSIVDMFDTLGFLIGVTTKTSDYGCNAG